MNAGLWLWLNTECRELLASVTDLLYPKVCEVCGDSLVKSEKYLCTHCLADFPFTEETFNTTNSILSQFSEDCRPVRLHSLFYYNKFSNYKNLIYLVKYHSYRHLGFWLGRMLGERIKDVCQADCMIPIPLHKKREKQRGFNQALEIARGINEVLHIELMEDVVIRERNNVSQTGKNTAERIKNVENIFSLVRPEKVCGRHVLLVDDVITTGATIGSCLRLLATAGEVRFSLGCLAQTI